jgi:two-component system chemotaxis response regulator CheB
MKKIKVLIVDDSAFARKVLREVLSQDSDIEVIGYARDGIEALDKIETLKPDVVTLDLIMPDLDGVGLLRSLPAGPKPKFLIVSVSAADADLAVEALQLGAFEIVSKPTALATERLYEMAEELIKKVKAAGAHAGASKGHESILEPFTQGLGHAPKVLVIGTSTGGPQALNTLFKALPAGLPFPILVALHIPPGYTASLAARITQIGQIPMQEAEDGSQLLEGRAYIAPGGLHLTVAKELGKLVAKTSLAPLDSVHHPSVDVLFHSAAALFGKDSAALVMTGMGTDGTIGAEAIRKAGGRVFAESASSCVVYGMPRSVIEAGLVNRQAPLEQIPRMLIQECTGHS